MKRTLLTVLASLTALSSIQAESNEALLDLLVRKKVISTNEAEAVRDELKKEETNSSAEKLKLSPWVEELKLGGDLRMRYQYDNRDFQVDPQDGSHDEDRSPSGSQRSRWRFRLRLNADAKLQNNWFAGVQLVTGQASDSDNQTYQDGYSDYGIYISRAFLGWNATDWLTFVGGKQPNPLYPISAYSPYGPKPYSSNPSELVWDADINPTGLTLQADLGKLFWGTDEEIVDTGFSKDGKTVASFKSAPAAESPWTAKLTIGAFIYDDNNEDAFDSDASTDAYQFVSQLLLGYQFSNGTKVTFAPGYMFFNAADLGGFNNENAFSDAPGVSGESRKMSVITAPGDIAFKVGGLKTKLYWDAAWNTSGRGRFDDIYSLYSDKVFHVNSDGSAKARSLHSPEDDFAYLVGIQLGDLKKAGDWRFRIDYRQTGISSVDPNLNESDFALGELNTRGFKTGLFYNFTDFVNAGVTYMYAWNLRDNLFGGQATGGAAVADSNVVQIFQVDLNLKF